MARKGGNPDIVELGKATQFPHNDPTKGGANPSIANELKAIALSDGYIEYDRKDCIVTEDKVRVKVPKKEQLAQKLYYWAMSKKGNDSMKAIDMIMNRIDDLPVQPIEDATKDTDDLEEQIKELKNVKKQLEKEIKGG